MPGSPDWNLHDDLASRAMRLVHDGVVEREGVDGLARRLGYTPRHVARVLPAELGAGPLALARAHRAQTARSLLAATELPITDIAFAAGFGSLRQFNDTIADVYRTTPGAIRASAKAATGPADARRIPNAGQAASLTLRLPARAPFDGAGSSASSPTTPSRRLEAGDATMYSRTARAPARPRRRDAHPGRHRWRSARDRDSTTSRDLADLAPLVARVRRLFDLDADSVAIDEALSRGPGARAARRAPFPASAPGQRRRRRDPVPHADRPADLGRRCAHGARGDGCARRADRPRAVHAPLPHRGTDRRARARGAARAGAARRRRSRRGGGAGGRRACVSTSETPRDGVRERACWPCPGSDRGPPDYLAMRVLGNPDILLTSDLVIRQGADRARPAGEAARPRRTGGGLGAVAQLRGNAPVAGAPRRRIGDEHRTDGGRETCLRSPW